MSKFYTKSILVIFYFVLSFFVSFSYALVDGVKIIGEKEVILAEPNKTITVQKIKLSPEFKQKFKQKLQELELDNPDENSLNFNVESYSEKNKNFDVDLGMSNVPVLDQGRYGTCVTFSTTAVINAYKNTGDYISQQCLLELGNYEEMMSGGYVPSGWDGAFFEDILLRINNYGIVDKKNCPHEYAQRNLKMTPHEYLDYSFNAQWAHDFNWRNINENNSDANPATIKQVKNALNNGHRVLVGSLLIMNHLGGLPIYDKNHALWDFPAEYSIKQFIYDINHDGLVGHAIIIIGYNDADGLFKIRNSWGSEAGDNGDFYMSYDFFEAMNIDAIEIY